MDIKTTVAYFKFEKHNYYLKPCTIEHKHNIKHDASRGNKKSLENNAVEVEVYR